MARKQTTEWDASSVPPPHEGDAFSKLWIKLLESPKWKKKPLSAIELACDKLKRFHSDFAATLIENAIVGNYQGVVFSDTEIKYSYWLNQKTNGNNRNTFQPVGTGGHFDEL